MEGMRFTWNRQNTRSFGKCLVGNPTRPPCSLTLKCVRRYRAFLRDVMSAILVYLNNEKSAILVYQISPVEV